MEFEYRIYEEVYNDMLSRKKTIEFRLLNEKSSNIQIGDKIKLKVDGKDREFEISGFSEVVTWTNIFMIL